MSCDWNMGIYLPNDIRYIDTYIDYEEGFSLVWGSLRLAPFLIKSSNFVSFEVVES